MRWRKHRRQDGKWIAHILEGDEWLTVPCHCATQGRHGGHWWSRFYPAFDRLAEAVGR